MNDERKKPADSLQGVKPPRKRLVYILSGASVVLVAVVAFTIMHKTASEKLALTIPRYPGVSSWHVEHFGSSLSGSSPRTVVYFDTEDSIDTIIQFYSQQQGWSVGKVQRNARGYFNTESATFNINGKEVELFFNDKSTLGESYYKGKTVPAHIHDFYIPD